MLSARVAPVSLFEVWLDHDDVRRANDLEPPEELDSLRSAVDFALRYQRKALAGAEIDRSLSDGDLLRWLAGRTEITDPAWSRATVPRHRRKESSRPFAVRCAAMRSDR
jgi:hypothetical protein